jgi:prepilin-type N-terminal cleavage/methylation domain-containing protein
MNASSNRWPRNGSRREHGFTLVEVVLALGIVSFSLAALIGMIPVAHGVLRDSGLRGECDRFHGILRQQLSGAGYIASAAALDQNRYLYFYRYTGNTRARSDTSFEPNPNDSLLLPCLGARWQDDPLLTADLAAISGPLFRLKLTRLPATPAALTPQAALTPPAIPAWAVLECVPSGTIGGAAQFVAKQAVTLRP